jgi:uncharacterized membrane protein/protein-disulfide isomerase
MEKIKKYSWPVAFFSTLAAVGLHGYLTLKFYNLRFGGVDGASACNLSDLWNCDAVSASDYAQFLGIPMAVWGAVSNLVLAFMLLFTKLGWYENDPRGKRYVFWLATAVAFASVVMGAISLIKLMALCLFCVFAYVLSATALGGTLLWAQPKIFKNLSSDLKALVTSHKGTLATFVAIPAMAWLFNSMFVDNYQMGQVGIFAEEKIIQWKQSPTQNFSNKDGLILFKGSGTPKMEIVEFADFRCPHCKGAYLSLDAFTEAHPDTRLIFKFFPLDGTCNPAMKGGGDGISCEAAFVTYCAETLFQKGWQVHHYLFENQNQLQKLLTRDQVRNLVCNGLSLDCAPITSCTEKSETREAIQSMAAEGVKAGVLGTPSVYVNGRSLSAGQLLPVLEKARQSLIAD